MNNILKSCLNCIFFSPGGGFSYYCKLQPIQFGGEMRFALRYFFLKREIIIFKIFLYKAFLCNVSQCQILQYRCKKSENYVFITIYNHWPWGQKSDVFRLNYLACIPKYLTDPSSWIVRSCVVWNLCTSVAL